MTNKPQPIVRRALGAGRWFPAEKGALQRMIAEYIDQAKVVPVSGRIVGAISPHAGYVYSGPMAGTVFRAIRDQVRNGQAPDTVVILGFSHQAAFRGVAFMDGSALATPLGEAALDQAALELLTKNRSRLRRDYAPHHGEHSAENQVPFVQSVLPKTPLVIGLIGDHDSQTVRELLAGLKELAGTRKILVVASSDMLHDPDYERVCKTDRETLKLVAALNREALMKNWSGDNQIFCGIMPVLVTLQYAQEAGGKSGTVLAYRNNGDDDPSSRGHWVVGYGAVIFATAVSER